MEQRNLLEANVDTPETSNTEHTISVLERCARFVSGFAGALGIDSLLRDIRSAIEQLQAPEADQPMVPAWIRSAEQLPEVGVIVLACYRNDYDFLRKIRAEYIPPRFKLADDLEVACISEWDEVGEQRYWPGGWYEVADSCSSYTHFPVGSACEVTHWTPLSAAPEEA